MDYDEAMNMSTYESYDELPSLMSWVYIYREIIFATLFIVGACADVAIIYTIFKFKRMRTVPNMFLANWAIADLCSLLVTPSTYRIISVLRGVSISHEFMCFLEQSGSSLHVNVLLFIIVVLIDWFISAYFGRTSERFRGHYKFVIALVWVFTIMLTSIFTGICMKDPYMYIHQIIQLFISYCVMLLLVVVFQCSRAINKFRNRSSNYPTLMLTLATVFTLSSFCSFMVLFFQHPSMHPVFEVIATCLLFSSSVFNFTFLYFLDKDFHACLIQALRCSGDRYEESISDFNNPIRNTSDKGPVNISIQGSEERLTDDY